MWNRAHPWASQGARRAIGLGFLTAILVLPVAIVGCTGTTPTPTPTPTLTPTPTAAPTPAPTPTPIATPKLTSEVTEESSRATGDQVAQEIRELLAIVPADYGAVTYLEINTLLQDPDLEEAARKQGVLAALGPLAGRLQDQVDAGVLAEGDAGLLGVLVGPLDVEGFVNFVKAQGVKVGSASHGRFPIWTVDVKLPILTLDLSIGVLDDTTGILTVSFSDDTLSIDTLKSALDQVDAGTPGFGSDPAVLELLGNIPQGVVMRVAMDCSPFKYEGCVGVAQSALKDGEELVINWILAFESPTMAQTALPATQSFATNLVEEPSRPLKSAGVSQEGDILRIIARGAISADLLGEFDIGGF